MDSRNVAKRSIYRPLAILALALIGVMTACAPGAGSLSQPGQTPTPALPAPQEALITFKPAISYAVALQALTDLGLQPTDNCYPADRQWHPMSQQDSFAGYHALLVAPTLLAPTGWLDRARSLPGFSAAQTNVVTNCPAIPAPSPTFTVPAPPEAQMSFAATTTYAAALEAMANLGVRLADPCYEAASQAGAHPSWHPMGQETTFADGHALVVASTLLAPGDWLKRAKALPAVRSIQTPVVFHCPNF